ncbi:unnamed protein product, partial [Mesorhabditis spiculigera]
MVCSDFRASARAPAATWVLAALWISFRRAKGTLSALDALNAVRSLKVGSRSKKGVPCLNQSYLAAASLAHGRASRQVTSSIVTPASSPTLYGPCAPRSTLPSDHGLGVTISSGTTAAASSFAARHEEATDLVDLLRSLHPLVDLRVKVQLWSAHSAVT